MCRGLEDHQMCLQDWRASDDDVMCTMFDMLCHLTPHTPDGASNPTAEASEGSAEALTESWCGALEAQLVAAAPVQHEGTRARRKRKLSEAAQAKQDGAQAQASSRVQWASPGAHRQAFRCATVHLCLMQHSCMATDVCPRFACT